MFKKSKLVGQIFQELLGAPVGLLELFHVLLRHGPLEQLLDVLLEAVGRLERFVVARGAASALERIHEDVVDEPLVEAQILEPLVGGDLLQQDGHQEAHVGQGHRRIHPAVGGLDLKIIERFNLIFFYLR